MRISHVAKQRNVPISVEYQGDTMDAAYRQGVATPDYLDEVQNAESADGQAQVICDLLSSWEFYGTVETLTLVAHEEAGEGDYIEITVGRDEDDLITYRVPATATAEEFEEAVEGGAGLFEVSGEPGCWELRCTVDVLGQVDVEGPVDVTRSVDEGVHFKEPQFALVRRLPLEFLNAIFQSIMDTMRPKQAQQRQSAGGSRARERAQRGRRR